MTQEHRERFSFNKDQLSLYLKRINFYKYGERQDKDIPINYETLERVINCHAKSIPFGNLAFSYYKRLEKPQGNQPCDISDPLTTKGCSTDLQDIFKKLVVEERDGLCFENNILCAYMLIELGFSTFLSESRGVNSYIWDKFDTVELNSNKIFVIIVELNSKEYLIDVGNSLVSISKPLLMEDGLIQETNPMIEHRLSRAPYPSGSVECASPKNIPWLLESRLKQLPNKHFNKKNDWSPIKYTNSTAYITPYPEYFKRIEAEYNATLTKPIGILLRSCIIMLINTDEGYISLRDQTLRICSMKSGIKTIKLNTEEERRDAYTKYLKVKVPEDHIEHLPNSSFNLTYLLISFNINYYYSICKNTINNYYQSLTNH